MVFACLHKLPAWKNTHRIFRFFSRQAELTFLDACCYNNLHLRREALVYTPTLYTNSTKDEAERVTICADFDGSSVCY